MFPYPLISGFLQERNYEELIRANRRSRIPKTKPYPSCKSLLIQKPHTTSNCSFFHRVSHFSSKTSHNVELFFLSSCKLLLIQNLTQRRIVLSFLDISQLWFFYFVRGGIVCWESIKHFGKNHFFFWRGLNPMKGGGGVGSTKCLTHSSVKYSPLSINPMKLHGG